MNNRVFVAGKKGMVVSVEVLLENGRIYQVEPEWVDTAPEDAKEACEGKQPRTWRER